MFTTINITVSDFILALTGLNVAGDAEIEYLESLVFAGDFLVTTVKRPYPLKGTIIADEDGTTVFGDVVAGIQAQLDLEAAQLSFALLID